MLAWSLQYACWRSYTDVRVGPWLWWHWYVVPLMADVCETVQSVEGTLVWDFWVLIGLAKRTHLKRKKILLFWFLICRDIRLDVHYRGFSEYVQIFYVFSQYMNRFIPHIQRYAQRNSVGRFILFRIFSLFVQIHSAHSQNTKYRFILRMLSIRTDSFRVFRECAEIISNFRNGIIFLIAFKGTLLPETVWMCVIRPKTQKE